MSDPDLPSLLILPQPPIPPSLEALKAVYHIPLTTALTSLASLEFSSAPAVLEVFVPCPRKYASDEPRAWLFEEVECLLAGVYNLICIISTQNSIETDGSRGVDARVIFHHPGNPGFSHGDNVLPSLPSSATGPIIDIQTFALTRRKWNYIFSVDGDNGQATLNYYMDAANLLSPPVHGKIRKIQGDISLLSSDAPKLQTSKERSTIHTIVAVGGTFDHLHAGHKLLLTATALLLQPPTSPMDIQRRLIIGITGDNLLKNKKYAEYLQSWRQRYEAVMDFLSTILIFAQPGGKGEVETYSLDEPTANGKAIHTQFKQAQITIECVEIQDPFGPTITDESVSALVVSEETRSGGMAVNMKREEKGWKPLEIFEVDVLSALGDKRLATETEEFAAKISSTTIRKRKAENARKSSVWLE